jgi:hypothetical protein
MKAKKFTGSLESEKEAMLDAISNNVYQNVGISVQQQRTAIERTVESYRNAALHAKPASDLSSNMRPYTFLPIEGLKNKMLPWVGVAQYFFHAVEDIVEIPMQHVSLAIFNAVSAGINFGNNAGSRESVKKAILADLSADKVEELVRSSMAYADFSKAVTANAEFLSSLQAMAGTIHSRTHSTPASPEEINIIVANIGDAINHTVKFVRERTVGKVSTEAYFSTLELPSVPDLFSSVAGMSNILEIGRKAYSSLFSLNEPFGVLRDLHTALPHFDYLQKWIYMRDTHATVPIRMDKAIDAMFSVDGDLSTRSKSNAAAVYMKPGCHHNADFFTCIPKNITMADVVMMINKLINAWSQNVYAVTSRAEMDFVRSIGLGIGPSVPEITGKTALTEADREKVIIDLFTNIFYKRILSGKQGNMKMQFASCYELALNEHRASLKVSASEHTHLVLGTFFDSYIELMDILLSVVHDINVYCPNMKALDSVRKKYVEMVRVYTSGSEGVEHGITNKRAGDPSYLGQRTALFSGKSGETGEKKSFFTEFDFLKKDIDMGNGRKPHITYHGEYAVTTARVSDTAISRIQNEFNVVTADAMEAKIITSQFSSHMGRFDYRKFALWKDPKTLNPLEHYLRTVTPEDWREATLPILIEKTTNISVSSASQLAAALGVGYDSIDKSVDNIVVLNPHAGYSSTSLDTDNNNPFEDGVELATSNNTTLRNLYVPIADPSLILIEIGDTHISQFMEDKAAFLNEILFVEFMICAETTRTSFRLPEEYQHFVNEIIHVVDARRDTVFSSTTLPTIDRILAKANQNPHAEAIDNESVSEEDLALTKDKQPKTGVIEVIKK